MQVGDRVKLANRIAHRVNRQNKHTAVDWTKCEGTIARVSLFSEDIAVQWDNRRTLDHWPVRALVLVKALYAHD